MPAGSQSRNQEPSLTGGPPGPARRTRNLTKGSATRARILDAAAEMFRERGYAGTRLSDIAAVAEVQAGTIFYHFGTRENLVDEVLDLGHEHTSTLVRGRVDALPSNADPLDRLREAISAHLTSVLERSSTTAAAIRILGQLPAEARDRHLGHLRSYASYLQSLIEQAQEAGLVRLELDSSTCRMLLLGAMNTTPDWFWSRSNRLTVEQLIDLFLMIFIDGAATSAGIRRRGSKAARGMLRPQPRRDMSIDEETDRRAARGDLILDAAARVFKDKSFAGATMTDVAELVDMHVGSLYYHFESREDLVTKLIQTAWEHWYEAVHEAIDGMPSAATPIDKLATLFSAHLSTVLEYNDYTSALIRMQNQMPPKVREASRDSQRKSLRYWLDRIEDASHAGQIRSDIPAPVLAMLLTGALNWTVEWYSPEGRLSQPELAREFERLVLSGMVSPQRRTRRSRR